MGGNHTGQMAERVTPRTVRLALAILVPVALVTLGAMIWLWPGGGPGGSQPGPQRVTGTVIGVDRAPCPELPPGVQAPPGVRPGPNGCGTVALRLTSGRETGRQVTTQVPVGPGAPTVAAGDDVVLLHLPDAGAQAYQIVDHQRGSQLWILAAAFALAVIAFGRWRGLTALAGLAVTFAVLLLFIVPAILDGKPPLLVAIVGATAIMLTVLYLTHGFTVPTTIAVIGTLASLVLTGLLSAITTDAAHLTGIADEDSSYLNMAYQVNMQGLLLAGILIGSLGVLDDVAVTQAATVTELAQANPGYGYRQLYAAATRIGRAHIASVINTIILAYAGASLPLLLLIAASNQPVGQVLTNQLIAQEIVRSAVGTIGLIAAVPITTALAALTARRLSAPAQPAPKPVPRPVSRPRSSSEWLGMYDGEVRATADDRYQDP